jgi:GTP-binding protein EngB required for normal cell division
LLFRVVLVKEKSEWDKAIAEYIKEESDVEFLVIKPSFKPTKQTEDRMLRVLWQKMGVPFILIKEREFA